MIPDLETCMKILEELNIPENILGHVKRVRKVALFIGKHWPEKIDMKLLEAVSLLHEICKMDEVYGKTKDHGLAAAEKLKKMGYEELYWPVARHTLWRLIDEDFENWSTEAIILAYADTLDVHGKVDTIESAFKRYRQRYPQYLEPLNKEEPVIKEIEKYIFQKTGLKFEDLKSNK